MNYQIKSRKYKTRGCIHIYWNNAPRDIHWDVWNIINGAVLRWEEAHPKGKRQHHRKGTTAIIGSYDETSGYVSSGYIPLEEHDAIVAQLREFMERVV